MTGRRLRRAGPGFGAAYARLWTASTVSNLGDGISLVAVPLLAASLTRDPFLVAVVAASGQLPWLLLSLPAGAIVDRVDRRRLVVAVDAVRTAVAAALAVAVWAGVAGIPLLSAAALLAGAGEVLYANAVMTLVPAVTGGRALEEANGRLMAGEIVTNQFAGQPLGGLLFGAAAALPFAADAATFLVSAVLLAGLAGRFRPAPAGGPRSLATDIGEGVRWLWRHALLRWLALLLGVLNLAGGAAFAVTVLFALEELGLSSAGVGVLLLGGAVGGLAGSLAASRLSARIGPGVAMTAGPLLAGCAYLVLAGTSSPWVAAAVLAVEGAFAVVWNVITVALRQAIVPDRLLGRVTSTYRLIGVGVLPLGALAGGALAQAAGLRAVFLAAGAATLAVAAVVPLVAGNRRVAAARAAAREAGGG